MESPLSDKASPWWCLSNQVARSSSMIIFEKEELRQRLQVVAPFHSKHNTMLLQRPPEETVMQALPVQRHKPSIGPPISTAYHSTKDDTKKDSWTSSRPPRKSFIVLGAAIGMLTASITNPVKIVQVAEWFGTFQWTWNFNVFLIAKASTCTIKSTSCQGT